MDEYKFPDLIASMAIHSVFSKEDNVLDYLKKKDFALAADLIQHFKKSEIEEAVNSGNINFAP